MTLLLFVIVLDSGEGLSIPLESLPANVSWLDNPAVVQSCQEEFLFHTQIWITNMESRRNNRHLKIWSIHISMTTHT